MKKTILSTAITALVAFSSATVVADDRLDWEAELNEQSQGLEDLSFDDILASEGFDDITISEPSKNEKVAQSKEKAILKEEVTKQKEVKIVNVEKKAEPIAEKVIVAEETQDFGFDFIDDETVMETDPSDLVFLRYVPEGTRFTIKETFKILPKKKLIIMHEGKRVLSNPQTELEPEKTLCYIQLKPSGKARILRSGTPFTVTGTKVDVKDTEVKKSYATYTLRASQIFFKIDNPNVVTLSCYSATMFEKGVDDEPIPLLIKDLKEQMGDIIKIDYPAYEEI